MGSSDRIIKRWLVVVGAILIQLCLGAIYAWNVFTTDLKDANGMFKFSNVQTQIIFSVGLATFALVMVFAGRWQAKYGPRIIAFLGGILLGAGYILAGLFGKNFITQVIFIGIIGGAGIGLAYVCPISVGMKWFPDKKGLITGLAVAGFGFGAFIWIQLAGGWAPLSMKLLSQIGVLKVFLIYGIVFAIAVSVGSIWMVNPPEGWKPVGWNPSSPQKGKGSSTEDISSSQMLRRFQFYSLWIMFIFSGMAGLMTIGIIKLFGTDALKESFLAAAGLINPTDAQADQVKQIIDRAKSIAGFAAVPLAFGNGIGRIVWGTISDKIGRKISLILMCAFQAVMMFVFYWMGSSAFLLCLGAALIGFNFGGNFALFPTATADFFGSKNIGRNYPWVFTAYGIGGIIGPIMAGSIKDIVGGWFPAFLISGIACLIAAGIALSLKPPKAPAKG